MRYIQTGSHIVSDGCVAYAGTEEINQGLYSYDVVIHQLHFAQEQDPFFSIDFLCGTTSSVVIMFNCK